MEKLIIGLVGPIASGKGIISEYLLQNGFTVVRLSDSIRDEAVKRKLEVTRDNLQNIGNDLRQKYGNQILAERTLQKFENSEQPICIDGVRNPGEVNYIKDHGGIIVGITAPEKLRLSWYLLRSKDRGEDGASEETFNISNNRDLGLGEADNGQQVSKCLELSNYTLENNSTKEHLIESFKKNISEKKDLNLSR
jgi:dephospho-CoA kinase